LTLAFCVLIASCGGGDGGGSGSAPSLLPDVTDQGGLVMAHPQIVPIFYANDADAATLTSFNQWIVTSQWLQTVGADYGVGTGSVLKVVRRTDTAPAMIDDTQIISLLYAGLADGSLPKPVGALADVLYMIYFPMQTTVTLGSARSCVDFGGYHKSARQSGVELLYAVNAACRKILPTLTDVEAREIVASHELIEAATDPVPFNRSSFRFVDPTNSWFGVFPGAEIGDLCQRGDGKEIWRESGFVAQRIWSISAAAAEQDPCVPGASTNYVNLVSQSAGVPRIAPGGHQTITLRGWASGAVRGASWPIKAASLSMMPGKETPKLSAQTIKDGDTVSLDVAVPASAQVGSLALFGVVSETQPTAQLLPMYAVVGAQCSQFTTCETCTAELGCGFCASSGKCEALSSPTSSAESSCSGSSFATSPGSCPDFCATFSDSCGRCTSQGCGWCSSGQPQCVAVNDFTGQQLSGSCPYADWSATPNYCSQ
jgi:hypothetical protein